MNKVIMALTAGLFVGSMAMAADNESKETATSDTSKNVLTGTETTKKKYKKSMKNKNGASEKVDVTETTKTQKDGKVTKDVEVEAKTENK